MPFLSSHHSSYISVSLCLPLAADTPTTRLLWLLHFCLSKRREETDLYSGSAPWHFVLEWQRRLWYPGAAGVWEQGMSPSLGGSLFFFLFFYYMWPNILTPASVRVAASSVLTQTSRALHQARGFVYIKIWSLRAAAGCRADSRPTSTSRWPREQNQSGDAGLTLTVGVQSLMWFKSGTVWFTSVQICWLAWVRAETTNRLIINPLVLW